MMRVALVTNVLPPYRVPIFNRLARSTELDFHVVSCAAREPNRDWDLPAVRFEHHGLRERFATLRGRYIHHNPDVMPLLHRLQPDVVITDGFNPTHLYAFAWARWQRRAHIAMTDGTDQSERSLSMLHRLVRRMVFAHSGAFIAASEGGLRLYRSYGINADRCTCSWLCIDNAAFTPVNDSYRPNDLMFCGRLEPAKGPLFALSVARETARRLGRRVSLLGVGDGSEQARLRDAAREALASVDVRFHGFARQSELPALYRSARVFLFPTHGDVWGIVANEACAAGLPVLVTPQAGVAGELVVEGRNGHIRDLQSDAWTACAARLLTDDAQWHAFSRDSLQRVQRYEFDSAAQGIIDACRIAVPTPVPSSDASIGARLNTSPDASTDTRNDAASSPTSRTGTAVRGE